MEHLTEGSSCDILAGALDVGDSRDASMDGEQRVFGRPACMYQWWWVCLARVIVAYFSINKLAIQYIHTVRVSMQTACILSPEESEKHAKSHEPLPYLLDKSTRSALGSHSIISAIDLACDVLPVSYIIGKEAYHISRSNSSRPTFLDIKCAITHVTPCR